MKVSKVINLFGGPGVGKSTLALFLAGTLKFRGLDAEYVPEYVKSWVWQGKGVGPFDQIYLLSKQIKAETSLYGKVDYIVTDSPYLLSPIYERLYSGTKITEHAALDLYERLAKVGNIKYDNYLIKRSIPYIPEGRYQKDEKEAMVVDKKIQTFLDANYIDYTILEGNTEENCETISARILEGK